MTALLDTIKHTIASAVGEHKRRIDICKSCEQLNPTLLVCSECGCALILKAASRKQKCPIGKW